MSLGFDGDEMLFGGCVSDSVKSFINALSSVSLSVFRLDLFINQVPILF